MEQPQEQAVPLPTVAPETEAPGEEEVAPTKSVKNFWERLDEVFIQNTELRERMEELVDQFPEFQQTQGPFKSYLFQPERIALSSNDDISPSSAQDKDVNPLRVPTQTTGHYPSEKFSSFRIRLKRPLRNVKSIQLLSAVIPNAIQNIPDNQTFFFFYKIRSVNQAYQGEWTPGTTYNPGDLITYVGDVYALNTTDVASAPSPPPINPSYTLSSFPANVASPNYYDLNPFRLKYIRLQPTFDYPFESTLPADVLAFNRTFEDYDDVVNSLNLIVSLNNVLNNCQNDVTFQYNPTLNKIIMIPNPTEVALGYYFMPCGYEDPNIAQFMSNPNQTIFGVNNAYSAVAFQYTPGYTLNLRLGFTWNGVYPNPFTFQNPWSELSLQSSLYWYLRPKDSEFYPGPPPAPFIPPWAQDLITFNSYGDLVNTSCVRLYADFALASTQDSLGSSSPANTATADGLLSIVPVNTNNLGVAFYQNNFNNALTKIPQNIAEIGITMLNDQGLPYYLPNSATVLLELAIDYSS